MSRRRAAILGVSLLLILPVLLQKHVQAGDLASHLYNTWLVLLVKSGEPLGLEIVPQYSNVLFDWWLEGLWRLGGPVFAEKTAVSVSVLLFFWGSFFLLTRLTGRPAWPSAPLLAMLAFGWIYHQGFFNYYLSCAFGFWAIGLAVSPGWRRWLAAPLLLLAGIAHLMGAAVAAGLAAYLAVRGSLPAPRRKWLLLGAAAAVAAVGAGVAAAVPAAWKLHRFMHLSAVTPFHVFHGAYVVPALLLLLFWITAALWTAVRYRKAMLLGPAAGAAALCAAALLILPTSLDWTGTRQSLFFVDWRLAPWFTLFLHTLLSARLPARFTLAALLSAAAAFFTPLSVTWYELGRMELAFHSAARKVPPRARTIASVTTSLSGMNPLLHMIDRACIGHCFSYGNYEPSTAQFRLRSRPGSPVVMDSPRSVFALQESRYFVRREDLPLYGLILKQTRPFSLEVRAFHAGEKVNREKVPLPPEWF